MGDWSAIYTGGQYYLFGGFDPAHSKTMSVGWHTTDDLNKPFQFCDSIGIGHPDPDICFAEGQFYLATQMDIDYVSPRPQVEQVAVRVGVDTDNDNTADHWTKWNDVKEPFDYTKGFPRIIDKTLASLDLTGLPKGYGF